MSLLSWRFFVNRGAGLTTIRRVSLLLVLGAAVLLPSAGAAQDGQPDGAVYQVKAGDSLWEIAARFKVSLDDLQEANGISDPGLLAEGMDLVIPGIQGYQGYLDTISVSYGENLSSLSRRYEAPAGLLIRLNRLTSPGELYAGMTLVVPAESVRSSSGKRVLVQPGASILELAARNQTNPWSLIIANSLEGSWSVIPKDVLRLPGMGDDGPGGLPGSVKAASVEPLPLAQGKTALVRISAPPGLKISGKLGEKELSFFPDSDGYVALQGIHALLEPGLYPLSISLEPSSEDGAGYEAFEFSQPVFVASGDYPFDPVLSVDPETIDPEITEPEDELWASLGTDISPVKMWESAFLSPVPPEFTECWTSGFGNRRSYNGSEYSYFHSGLDFCGGEGTQLFAPAAGEVIFAGPLTVRGNATVIDHGWGVYTAYDHQSDVYVKPGDIVVPGQLIGLGGATGRVTGPHLHWEVWVGGVQVDPVDWLQKQFP